MRQDVLRHREALIGSEGCELGKDENKMEKERVEQ